MSIAMRHVNERVPAPSAVSPGVPAELDAVVLRATEKDPQARFQDASEMAAAIGVVLDPRPVMAGAVAPTTPLPTSVAGGETQTVWPIPGDRWDPTRLGRRVLLFFGVLGVIALLLLVSRIAGSADPPERSAGRAAGAAQSPDTATDDRQQQEERPIVGEIDPDIIGMDLGYVEGVLDDRKLPYEVEYLAGDELIAFIEETGVKSENAEAGEIVGTDPPPDGSIREGETITLFVSEGLEDDDAEHPSGKPPKDEGKGKGHSKDDEKDDD